MPREIRIMDLSRDTGHPGAQPCKRRLTLFPVATNEHEPGAEGAETRGSFKSNPGGRSGDDAGFALHVLVIPMSCRSAGLPALIEKQVPKARWRQLGVPHRVLDRPVP